jgi:hypothetical protein
VFVSSFLSHLNWPLHEVGPAMRAALTRLCMYITLITVLPSCCWLPLLLQAGCV